MSEQQRSRFWRSLGASRVETDELVGYARNRFDFSRLPASYPVPDEPFVSAWRRYRALADRRGVLACLREVLVQLRFPISSGMSERERYRAATRRGLLPDAFEPELQLVHPHGLQLFLQPTPAGHVPVLVAEAREDFVALVQALSYRNEPTVVPAAVGACMVAGYNNWERVAELRRSWEEATPAELRSPEQWQLRFREIASVPALYQDRFILLSSGPYSGVAAADVGLSDDDWRRRSAIIRLEHECTHYFTRQLLGSMRNALFDELLADYMGLVASEGRYRADWFLRFMGLEDLSHHRSGSRMESYRGDPPLSDGAFAVLQSAARRAAHNLQRCDERRWRRCRCPEHPTAEKAAALIALARLGLEGLASSAAPELFETALSDSG